MSQWCLDLAGAYEASLMEAVNVFVEYAEEDADAGSSVRMTVSYVRAQASADSDGLHWRMMGSQKQTHWRSCSCSCSGSNSRSSSSSQRAVAERCLKRC